MGLKTLKCTIQNKSDTSENWTQYNPVLKLGEIGYIIDEKKIKIGDGETSFSDLEYANPDAPIMVGASGSQAGQSGLVPAPSQGTSGRFLDSTGNWSVPSYPTNVNSANKLSTARTITLSGDASGSTSFDGSANVTIDVSVSNSETSNSSTKATQDSQGQTINSTYIKGLSISGKTITYTKGNGITGTITTQDTTYPVMTGATSTSAGTSGLVPAPTTGQQSLFLKGDGTWATPTNTTYTAASGGGLSLSGTAFSISDTGVTAGKYGQSSGSTLSFGGTFSIPYITVNSKGQATSISSVSMKLPSAPTSVSGNAGTATKLLNSRTISLSGDATGSVSFDGTQNANIVVSINDMVGASSSASGKSGFVPAPSTGKQNSFLRGDGTWATPTNTTYTASSGGGLTLSGTAFSITNTGISANSYGQQSSASVSFGGTFTIPYITFNSKGQATAAYNRTITMPSAPTTITGNAGSATKLQTSRDINGVPFNGTQDISVPNNYFKQLTNADLNKQLEFGDYYGAEGNTCTNKPSGIDWFYLRVFRISSGYTGQLIYSTEKEYTRYYNGTTWTNWAVYYSSVNKPPLASTTASGLLKQLSGSTSQYLRGDGTWATPPNTTYSVMKGATSSSAGTSGLVPAPAAGKQTSFLRGDGTWVVPTNTTYSQATSATLGLVKIGFTESGKNYPVELNSSGQMFVNVPWTDNNTTYTAASGGGLTLSGNAFSISASGVTAASYGPSANATLKYGGTFTVPYLTVNSKGQLTAAATRTFTMPAAATLTSLGITATAKELNYVDGVTSSIQTQLNGKLSTNGNAASATYATSIKDQRASTNYKIWVGPQASVPSTLASATIYFVY